MKRLIILLSMLLSASMQAGAIEYEPTTTWPYLYSAFQAAAIVKTSGERISRIVNVCLAHGELHFIDGETVREADLGGVRAVEVGGDVFLPVGGGLMKVLARSESCCIVEEQLVDFNALNAAPGAYGSSSTSSASTRLSSIQLPSQVNQNHMLLQKEKSSGKVLPLVRKLYVTCPEFVARAAKSDISDALPEEARGAFKAWLKSHKVRWSDPSSLLQIGDFVSSLRTN